MPTHIHKNKKVLLMGGGLGNAVLFSIGQELIKTTQMYFILVGYTTYRRIFFAKIY